MTEIEIFENLMYPLTGTISTESWEFLINRFNKFLEQRSKYNNIETSKPLNEQPCIVCDGNVHYELAFFSEDLGFINERGILPEKFKYWKDLPTYKQ